MVGKTISHYRVLEKLGEGGMGEVYRAEDTSLKREVAIKVLPEQFTQDPQRLARFEREARLLASLNHPNIAAIYSFEHAEGLHFLVLELVEGETLAKRVVKGPLPVEEALQVCRQIAEGVEAAHEKGVIHRDLKPANVKITPKGQVKVLDFGLAKALESEIPAADISNSATLTEEMTRAGVILGTAPYMSPEQARGKPVDKRTDIWAFGCVLYELLTGKRAFQGETVTDTIAKVLESEPDWEALPETRPWNIVTLLHRCLQKEPDDRLHDIADARIEIKEALKEPATVSPIGVISRVRPARWRLAIPWVLALVISLMAGFTLWSLWRKTAPRPQEVKRFIVNLPSTEPLCLVHSFQRPGIALSPDGQRLVYVATPGGIHQLYLREMDEFQTRPIPGTEDARNPFFSPEGEWVAFLTGGKLKKVSLSSGAVVTLCDVFPDVSSGGSWGPDDNVFFAPTPGSGLARVSAQGGTSEPVTTPDRTRGERGHYHPKILPGGKAVLFTIRREGGFSNTDVGVLSLETGEWHTLIEGGTSPHYLSTGHLVYARAGALLAVPFDAERLKVIGSPVRILEGLVTKIAAEFSLSADGSLVYLAGTGGWPEYKLVWVDREGQALPFPLPPRTYQLPRLSPDGQRLALTIINRQMGNQDIWVCGLAPPLSRLTFTASSNLPPIWTTDGKRVTFGSADQQPPDLVWRPADGTGAEEKLLTMEYAQFPTSWSPDGRTLLFTDEHPDSKLDIWWLAMEDERKPQAWLKGQFNETAAVFSPDGNWIAYQSDESGRHEVYVRPFTGPGPKQQISTEGGTEPVWAPDGSELFYRNGDRMMVVVVRTHPKFAVAKPKLLFEGRYITWRFAANYDVAPDGQRFVMIQSSDEEGSATQIHVVLNWFEEVERLVPAHE